MDEHEIKQYDEVMRAAQISWDLYLKSRVDPWLAKRAWSLHLDAMTLLQVIRTSSDSSPWED